jgi:hypothetical protein
MRRTLVIAGVLSVFGVAPGPLAYGQGGARHIKFELTLPNLTQDRKPMFDEETQRLMEEEIALTQKVNGTKPLGPGETQESVQQQLEEVRKKLREARRRNMGRGHHPITDLTAKKLEYWHRWGVVHDGLKKWCAARSAYLGSGSSGSGNSDFGSKSVLNYHSYGGPALDLSDLQDDLRWATWRKPAEDTFHADVDFSKIPGPPELPDGASDVKKALIVLQSEADMLYGDALKFLAETTPDAPRRIEVLDTLIGYAHRRLPADDTQAMIAEHLPGAFQLALLRWSTVDDLPRHLKLLLQTDRLFTYDRLLPVYDGNPTLGYGTTLTGFRAVRTVAPLWRNGMPREAWLKGLALVIQADGGMKAKQLADLDVENATPEEVVNAYFLLPKAKQTAVLKRLRDGKGAEYTTALVNLSIGYPDNEPALAAKNPVRPMLDERLARMTAKTLKAYLASESAEIRLSALRVAAKKGDKSLIPDILPNTYPAWGGHYQLQPQANKTMVSLTGAKIAERYPNDPDLHDVWEKWWRQNGGR